MSCSQCQGIEELFSPAYVEKELQVYRSRGPDRTTRMLTAALRTIPVEGLTLLDIGGGLGAIPHDLLAAGVREVTSVEASSAYLTAARAEMQRRGYAGQVRFYHGDFVDIAGQIPPADIVTLDRVICCYPDMESLVSLSAERTRKLYGLVYPRDTWWTRAGFGLENIWFRQRGSSYRAFVHPTKAVEDLLARHGLNLIQKRQTLVWQVAVFAR
ncbi:MAG: methyltransferase domain-containing protein [Chloroflexi bacterium]|jgi:predicted TPR repeat methyltransferase|nr:methyltransferase domain-containing protein [Chloroflexota bacterium]